MAFIPVPNTVEVCITFQGGGKPQKVCFNVTSAVAWTLAAMQQLGRDVVSAIVTDGLPWITSVLSATSLHLTDISSSSGTSFDWILGNVADTLPQVGTGPATPASGQAALVTTLRTFNRGRSFRGRNYWPGIVSTAIGPDGETVGPTRVGDQNAFVGNLIAAVNSLSGRTFVVVSRHTGKAPRVTGITTPVTSHDTNNRVDTQRRRVQP